MTSPTGPRLPGFADLQDWTHDKWATPPTLVAEVEREFGPFDLDPCCEDHTAKAPTFYTSSGLERPWFGHVWLNPPYSEPLPWLRRAAEATTSGDADLVVALLRVATDTAWFHDWVLPFAELRFIRGRVKFLGGDERPAGVPPWASMFALYRSAREKGEAEHERQSLRELDWAIEERASSEPA